MEKIFIAAFIVCLATSCKKSENKSNQSTSSSSKCYVTKNIYYDANGNSNTYIDYYYTGNRLDSFKSFFNNIPDYVIRYNYTSNNERKKTRFSYTYNKLTDGYALEQINDKGDITMETSYDNNGSIIYRWSNSYKCN